MRYNPALHFELQERAYAFLLTEALVFGTWTRKSSWVIAQNVRDFRPKPPFHHYGSKELADACGGS